MNDEPIYEEWIANRQTVEPSCELTDRVMTAIERQDTQRNLIIGFVERLNNSLPARCAACVLALLVGCLPFFYVAYAAKLIVF